MCDSALTVLAHVVGAAPGSTNILATLRRLTHEIKRQFGLVKDVPEDFKWETDLFLYLFLKKNIAGDNNHENLNGWTVLGWP